MPMPKYLRNLDGTAGKPRLSEGTMLSEGPVNDCNDAQMKIHVRMDILFSPFGLSMDRISEAGLIASVYPIPWSEFSRYPVSEILSLYH